MITEAYASQVPQPLLEVKIRQLQMLLSETMQKFNSRIFNNTPENLTVEQVAEISVLAEALFVKVTEVVPSGQASLAPSGLNTGPSHSPQEKIPAHPGGAMTTDRFETKLESTGMCIERFM